MMLVQLAIRLMQKNVFHAFQVQSSVVITNVSLISNVIKPRRVLHVHKVMLCPTITAIYVFTQHKTVWPVRSINLTLVQNV